MVFNATFKNISVISWWSVLLAEETGENDQPNFQKLNILAQHDLCSLHITLPSLTKSFCLDACDAEPNHLFLASSFSFDVFNISEIILRHFT
jgi:hypothetical protein